MKHLSSQEIIEIFHQRASTRQYDPNKKISEADFQTILELARLSPSSVGSEPWFFLVIQDRALRQKLKPISWGMATQIDDASHLVVILAKKNVKYDSEFLRESMIRRGLIEPEQQKMAVEKYRKFQLEDSHIGDNERTLFDWASKQTYIALANMLTGAAILGIDSCPIEGFDVQQATKILSEVGLFDSQEWGISVMATFGYRAVSIKPKSRKPLEIMVKWF